MHSQDFDGDGFDDLAVGIWLENVPGVVNAGAAQVFYGSSAGLSVTGNQLWHQNSPSIAGGSEEGDKFGAALAYGDFDGDGYDDLAIGAYHEAIGSTLAAGAVNVIYGSAAGLQSAGNQIWHQDSAGIAGGVEAGDEFGRALACGDFDGDGFDDLAVGVVGEDQAAGAVNVIYGSAAGLTSAGNQWWNQDSAGIPGASEADDRFGWALTSGDFDADGYEDLAIGVPGEDVPALGGDIVDAGSIRVIYGSASGLTGSDAQAFDELTLGGASTDIGFGETLTTGKFDLDPYDELVVGSPGASPWIRNAGEFVVLRGSRDGVTRTGFQYYLQGIRGVPERLESGDRFAAGLTTGNFNGDGFDDVGVGIPGETDLSQQVVGAGMLFFSSSFGLQSTGVQGGYGIRLPSRQIENRNLGNAVTAGDYNGDGYDDFALGDSGWDLWGISSVGGVRVVYGSPSGITLAGTDLVGQEVPGVLGASETGDGFGFALPQ